MRRREAGRRRVAAAVLSLLVLVAAGAPSAAQQLGLPQSVILTISSERLFAESAFGRRVAREIETESGILATENRRIEAELTAEERELTNRRAGMEAAEFRVMADAFDAKVQTIRDTQEGKARALGQRLETARVEFLQAARPILEAVMREAGAGVILERSSVFLSANATDVTDLAILRIDAAIGDGATKPEAPESGAQPPAPSP